MKHLVLTIFAALLPVNLSAVPVDETKTRPGHVTSMAGNGKDIPASPDGLAVKSPSSLPFGISLGPDGVLYVCEVGSH